MAPEFAQLLLASPVVARSASSTSMAVASPTALSTAAAATGWLGPVVESGPLPPTVPPADSEAANTAAAAAMPFPFTIMGAPFPWLLLQPPIAAASNLFYHAKHRRNGQCKGEAKDEDEDETAGTEYESHHGLASNVEL
ncbi:hypothetical protein Vafri_19439 [Volvox africanus]|uniref:Uncharacterized protein n=1 Tax=Volvox africanus TaxID=51714 RepID=A0A8J4BPD8_9CHLO|nr:hypothetical protein Vafri_19439 [Volvox africanus]